MRAGHAARGPAAGASPSGRLRLLAGLLGLGARLAAPGRAAAPGPRLAAAPRAQAPAPRADTLTADCAGQRLLQWLATEGADVSPDVQLAALPELGRELVAVAPIDAGTELLKLPAELCIPAPPPSGEGDALPEDVRLAAALLELERVPRWEAYLAVWPTAAELAERLPVFWGEERLRSTSEAMPGLVAQVRSRRRLLAYAADRLGLPLTGLMWAHALVSTRAVGAGINACAMLPGVDMALSRCGTCALERPSGSPTAATRTSDSCWTTASRWARRTRKARGRSPS